jgi:hypothetical protein
VSGGDPKGLIAQGPFDPTEPLCPLKDYECFHTFKKVQEVNSDI